MRKKNEPLTQQKQVIQSLWPHPLYVSSLVSDITVFSLLRSYSELSESKLCKAKVKAVKGH